jgi:hypothetical protein
MGWLFGGSFRLVTGLEDALVTLQGLDPNLSDLSVDEIIASYHEEYFNLG